MKVDMTNVAQVIPWLASLLGLAVVDGHEQWCGACRMEGVGGLSVAGGGEPVWALRDAGTGAARPGGRLPRIDLSCSLTTC
jgi:hypothetical protein